MADINEATLSSASSTIHTYLLYKESTSDKWKKLVDIKDYPSTGGTPEKITTTTLSNEEETSTDGVKTTSSFEFLANYTVADYKRLKNLEQGKQVFDVAIAFGKPYDESLSTYYGSIGVFKWQGAISVWLEGGSVNGLREMRLSTSKLTDVEFLDPVVVETV